MTLEYTLPRIDSTLVKLPDAPATLTVEPQRWWAITQVVLAGLLLAYIVGVVQDIQRVRDLRAEPPALSKIVITKNEAWQRVYTPSARLINWQLGTRLGIQPTSQP